MASNKTTDAIRALIQRYLDLIEIGQGSVKANETALVEILDRLAGAIHEAPRGETTDDVDAPERRYETMRSLVVERFPNYGFYGSGCLLDLDKKDERFVGDAIDDIADIALDLHEAAWTWDNVGVEDGLWMFHFGFEYHWGMHLRELQTYLHRKRYMGLSSTDAGATCAGLNAVKGARVEAVTYDDESKGWLFAFRDHGGLRVDCPWQIFAKGELARAGGDHQQQYGLPTPIDAAEDATRHLAGRAVKDICVDSATADLSLRMRGDVTLRVVADSTGYEAWHLVAPDGREFIGRGDGLISLPPPKSED